VATAAPPSRRATRRYFVDDVESTPFKPPYMSFQTFWNFIEELATRPLPPQIDRSLMSSKSGTDQNNLTTALRGFGLTGPDQQVLPALLGLAMGDEGGRKEKLAELVRTYYPQQLVISEQNGTEQQLHDSFRETFGLDTRETRRKAVTFFLHAARTAGIELSPHFPATRSGSGSPGVPRPKRTSKRKNTQSDKTTGSPADHPRPNDEGDSYSVSLSSGGSVSVVVSVNLFSLSTEDRDFVIDLVDKLKGYPQSERRDEMAGEGA
jgi:hypothetical protein